LLKWNWVPDDRVAGVIVPVVTTSFKAIVPTGVPGQ